MTACYIGLGSNLADPVRQIKSAIAALGKLPETRLVKNSSLYRSQPLGRKDQPEYINAVVELETSLTALTLLSHLQGIESAHGRTRAEERWASRTLDLDLLMYGNAQIFERGLRIPHPEIPNRNFVLCPLLEIQPDIEIPGLGPAKFLLEKIGMAGLEKLSESITS